MQPARVASEVGEAIRPEAPRLDKNGRRVFITIFIDSVSTT